MIGARRVTISIAVMACFSGSILLPLHSPAAQADEGGIVARVNGTAITARDLETEIDRILPRVSFHGSVSGEARKEFREQALERLIDRELQYQEALAKGLKPDAGQIKQRMSNMRDQFPSKREYKKALEQAGLTEKKLLAQVEKDVLIGQIIESTVTVPSRMSDADLKKYYDQNTSKFVQPESVHLRIISAKDEKKAKEAYARVKGGEAFGTVAGMMSEDNYRIRGGDIGIIHRGRLLPDVERTAFGMKAGEVSGLISVENTWYIIKVEASNPARQVTFAEAKDKMQKDLESKRAKELLDKWIADLRSNAKIELIQITSPE